MKIDMNNFHRLALFAGAVKSVLNSRLKAGKPFFVSHLITTRCFAKCPTCIWRGNTPEEWNTDRIIRFYKQARQEGFVSTTFWGGEPLLREDVFDICRCCRKFGLVCGLITNGYLLPQYASQVAHNLDFLIVSVDFPSKEHDRYRGVDGIFQNAMDGILRVRKENPRLKIFLNSVVSAFNYDQVDGLVALAEKMGTTITFESVNTEESLAIGEGKERAHFGRLDLCREQAVFAKIRALKSKHACINNSMAYLNLFANGAVKYRCHAREISIRVEPDGCVTNCLDRAHPLGNVYEDDLHTILKSPRMRGLQKRAENCCSCVDSGVIESSLSWEFNSHAIRGVLRMFLH